MSEKHDGEAVYFATEIANARTCGFALTGPPAEDVFPAVPEQHCLDGSSGISSGRATTSTRSRAGRV